jgi:hypothetical protein
MLIHDLTDIDPEIARRRALAKVYALLIRLGQEKEKQTALPDNFGEETGKAEAQTPTVVETCND